MNLKQIFLTGCFLMSVMALSQKNIFDIARSGSVDEVKKLMAINPDTINKINSAGYLPLTLACYRGNEAVAFFLAEHVKDINGGSNYGTALMAAVFQNKEAIVKALLKFHADPNLSDKNGATALQYAVMKRNEPIIKLLIDANADVNAEDNRGNSAMDYGKMTQNKNIIELLTKK
jgi:ankyrin repeat protein